MRLMIEFVTPLLLGMLFQQFCTMVVGKFLGVDALAV